MKMARGSGIRSRNGCFTCRRRKKKCDESHYPICNNCSYNSLECTWPDHVSEFHTLIKAGTGADYDSSGKGGKSRESSPYQCEKLTRGSPPITKGVSKPKNMTKNYILQRISMQQECVEDLDDDSMGSSELIQPASPTGNAAPITSIRDRIAQQLDIPGGVLVYEDWQVDAILEKPED